MINFYAVISLVIRLSGVLVLLLYVIPKQIGEVWNKPKDWLTNLRWYILMLFSLSILTSIPSVWYQFYRVFGIQSIMAQNVVSICTNISILCTNVLLVLIYNYRQKQ